MILAAELPPPQSYQAIGWILVGLGALAGLMTGIRYWIRSESGVGAIPQGRTIEGQPLRVTQEPKFVATGDYARDLAAAELRFQRIEVRVEALHADIASVRREIHTTELNLLRAADERAGKIHERINVLLAAISELKGRTEHQH